MRQHIVNMLCCVCFQRNRNCGHGHSHVKSHCDVTDVNHERQVTMILDFISRLSLLQNINVNVIILLPKVNTDYLRQAQVITNFDTFRTYKSIYEFLISMKS